MVNSKRVLPKKSPRMRGEIHHKFNAKIEATANVEKSIASWGFIWEAPPVLLGFDAVTVVGLITVVVTAEP